MSQSPLLAQLEALQQAEQFAARFEDDAAQQPAVTDLLAKLRTQINVTLIALDTLRVQLACRVANSSLNDWATQKLFVGSASTADMDRACGKVALRQVFDDARVQTPGREAE